MFTYECVFDFEAKYIRVRSEKGIAVFSQGFWINAEHEYTVGEDCLWWIPPHRVLYIKKVALDPPSEDHDYKEEI